MVTVSDLDQLARSGALGRALAGYLDVVEAAPVGSGAEKRAFAALQAARDEVFDCAEALADSAWCGEGTIDSEIVLLAADAEDVAWDKLIDAVTEAGRRRSRYRPHTRERLTRALGGYAHAWMRLAQTAADARD